MNIQECILKIKVMARFLDRRDVIAALTAVSLGIASFYLGRLAEVEVSRGAINIIKGPECPKERITYSEPQNRDEAPPKADSSDKKAYVGSRTGSKYHLPDCPGAKMISEANKIWFSSKIEAEKAGFKPAGNCKGL